MAEAGIAQMVGPVIVLLGSAVVAVPLFRRLGLGSVLGYFAGGLLVGPSVLGIFTEPSTILHISELGVVMFLFLIGVEMRPRKLWGMRGQIFGLGLGQVLLCMALLTGAGLLLGLDPVTAFIAGAGFVLSSTAVIMSVLQERGDIASAQGQQAVSILLLEDLMIVPLLAVVAFLGASGETQPGLLTVLVPLGAVALLIGAGVWLLDPFFALLARARTTEVLTAGALLVVLGSALLMQQAGLSMAMGAFLAGVLLSGSGYRHQIETDVEPFKGLLMGLFFLAVGMSLDLRAVAQDWVMILGLLVLYILVKSLGIFAVARLFGASPLQGLRRVSLFAQGGEFAFVLYAAAVSGGVIDAAENAIFSSVIILSMAVTPLVLLAADRWLAVEAPSMDGVEPVDCLKGRVLMIGFGRFGRFGQIASQMLLAQGVDVALIDNDPDRIREARRFGFTVYYGDGTRLDILRQSGAGTSDMVLVCVDDPKATDRIVGLVAEHFPSSRVLARSYDRGHSIRLRQMGVDFEIRETFESALAFGGAGLRSLGMTAFDVAEVEEDIRRRDIERLEAQAQGNLMSGRDSLHVEPRPEPLVTPRQRA